MNKRKSKGGWKYFLDFFLLFLAVSLGFLADNFREKYSERSKEGEYIKSMIEDVKTDRTNISEAIRKNRKRSNSLDSLINICFNYNSTQEEIWNLNKYFGHVLFHPEFIAPTELTMQQLKNAGGMRLIKSKDAINEIIRYDLKAKKLANQQLYYENYQNIAIDRGTKILNLQTVLDIVRNQTLNKNDGGLKLLTENDIKFKELGNSITMYKGIIDYYTVLLEEMNEQGELLSQTLTENY